MTASKHQPHLLVLGGGPAGYAAAFHAADLGLRVTLVDLEPNPGGVSGLHSVKGAVTCSLGSA